MQHEPTVRLVDDNPMAQDFFTTRQHDFVHCPEWRIREEARADLFEYTEVW